MKTEETVTPRQIAKTISLIAQSGIIQVQYQTLLKSGKFTALLREFMEESAHDEPKHPKPTIKSIKVCMDYSRTLVEIRDSDRFEYRDPNFNDVNFPVERGEDGEREFFLVSFKRGITDDEDPARSEILLALDKLGFRPEGAMELCTVGMLCPELMDIGHILGRRQLWQSPDGKLCCPDLGLYNLEGPDGDDGLGLGLTEISHGWGQTDLFLCSRKPVANGDSK